MFDIEYKGANGLVIETKKTRLVVDPKLSVAGLKDLSVKNSVEIATEARFVVEDDDARLIVEGPGEYEVGDFSIRGFAATRHLDTDADEKKSTIYRVEVGEVSLAILGNVMPKLTEQQLEDIGVIDILIIPVGGNGYTLDATSAATFARQIDPKVVVPIHYKDPNVSYEVPQDELETFTKELGAPVETTPKYKIKAAASIPSVLTVIEIERS